MSSLNILNNFWNIHFNHSPDRNRLKGFHIKTVLDQIKENPVKFGLKCIVVSDSDNDYIFYFIPYFGKEGSIPDSNLLKTT